jgi:hypothetical protein
MEASMTNATQTPTLKLKRLPDRVPAKVLVTIPPELKRQLAAYAELYRETYGEEESVETLIPFILAAFMGGDPTLKRRLRKPRVRRQPRQAA